MEAGSIFLLVEKLHRVVEQHMEIDSFIGKGAIARILVALKDRPSKVMVLSLATVRCCLKHRAGSILTSYSNQIYCRIRLNPCQDHFATTPGWSSANRQIKVPLFPPLEESEAVVPEPPSSFQWAMEG